MSGTTEELRTISVGLAFLILGCQNSTAPSPTGTPIGKPASETSSAPTTHSEAILAHLHLDEVVTVGPLSLRLLALNDSRCPLGVQCVWEGRVVATVEATSDDSAPQRIEIILHPGTEPVAEAISGHELRLLRIEPHPREGVTPEHSDYVASVEILKI